MAPSRSRGRRAPPAAPFALPRWMQSILVVCAAIGVLSTAFNALGSYNSAYRQSAVQESAVSTTVARVAPLEARVAALETRIDTGRTINQQTFSGLTGRVQAIETAQTASIAQDAQTATVLERLSVQVAELKDQVRDLSRRLFDRAPMQRGDAEAQPEPTRTLPARWR